jgi:hypothetical protein
MDSNTFLLGWAFTATCVVGYYQAKAIKYKKRSSAITFLLCEVACGEVKPKIDGKQYTLESDGITFKFEREQNG